MWSAAGPARIRVASVLQEGRDGPRGEAVAGAAWHHMPAGPPEGRRECRGRPRTQGCPTQPGRPRGASRARAAAWRRAAGG
eukprot:1364971-Alexandrium_andersonii.AAC.1